MKELTMEMLETFRRGYENDRAARTASAAMAKTEISELAFLPAEAARLNGAFSIEVKTRGITAQEKSGRCWMFALLNMLREQIAERCGLEFFELSENYLAFYDKLEKSNNMLEMVIANAEKPLSDRKMEYILEGFWDGGYWDMAADLVKKYGIVPKDAMPETYQSSHTEQFMRKLTSLLRKDAAELRRRIAAGEDVSARKQEMMAEIYKAECIAFGCPPRRFDFSWRDSSDKYHIDRSLTPVEFFRNYTDMDLDAFVTITNEPTHLKKEDMLYQFHYIGCMAEGDIRCLNLSMPELKNLCIEQLKDGVPVWFGCDSGAYGARREGVWDPVSFDFDGLFGGVDFFMEKGERLEYRDSFATHAMILTGVNLDAEGKPDRWKIENSWGKEVGKDGYFVCSDAYFDEFVYEAIIDRRYLNERQLALLEQEPVVIEPWME